MLTSLQTAISGMRANGTYISVIADNIANMNTVGFKKTTLTFGDILSSSITGVSGSAQVGRGVLVQKVSPLFTQGPLETTENSLDLAVDGNGFFIVKDNGAQYYTRSGKFDIDNQGYIVSASGLRLQGYLADDTGRITGQTGDLRISATQTPSRMTTSAMNFVNLDGNAEIYDQADPNRQFNIIDSNSDGTPDKVTNYNFSSTIRVYDSQGGANHVTLYYVKTAVNTWQVHYVYDRPPDPTDTTVFPGGWPGGLTEAANGPSTLVFDEWGALASVDGDTSKVGTVIPQFNFGGGVVGGTPPGPVGIQGISFDHSRNMQHKSDFAVLDNDQDGYSSGSLERLIIAGNGEMTGIFSNGQARFIGQVALAKFIAPTELLKIGWNLYTESTKSGQPVVSYPSTSGLGDVVANTVELSNVDLAQEFVNLITAQRGFQANSRIVTTTDELMAEVVNLKR